MPQDRAVVYTRQSKDLGQNGLAVERQRVDCERLAAERGWRIVRTITDNDVSATTGTRPGYNELLAMAETRAVDVIVCWHVDRLTRKLTELEHVIEVCERTGVRVATVSGDLDLSTDAGRLVGRILASVAKGEVERKSARQSRAGRQAAESGNPPTRRAFGYLPGGRKIDSVEGPAVRDAFAALLAGGSIVGITRRLNDAGLRTVGGKAWTAPGVRLLLRNGRYAAIRVYRRTEEVGPGNWPPIVSEETWRAAVALLDDPVRRATLRSTARRWLGSAYYECGRCGSDMCIGYRQYGDAKRRVYRCRAHLGHLTRVAEPVDAFVSAVVAARLRRADLGDLLEAPAADTAPLRAEAATLRLRIEQLADDIGLDEVTLARRVKALQGRLNTIREELAQAGRTSALGSVLGGPDPAAAWLSLTDVAARQAVARELCAVTLLSAPTGRKPFDPDSVRVEWRTP